MAIFYNHIKGCGASSTGQASSTKDLWTWIKFADITGESVNTDLTDSNMSVEYLPSILLYSSNDMTNISDTTDVRKDFGKIITSKAINQQIEKDFTFVQNLYFKKDRGLCWAEVNDAHVLTCGEEELTLRHPSKIGIIATTETVFPYKIKIDDNNTTTTIIDPIATYTFHTTGTAKINHCLYVGTDTENKFNPTTATMGTIKAEHKCEALYFNATSDRRAKSNITPTEFSALSVVNALSTYTFNYHNKQEKTLGLIAQEAAKFDLDGFNMVDNLQATGQGSDMMQMKESKLVYVLWKAVQELSAEVEALKTQIASLK